MTGVTTGQTSLPIPTDADDVEGYNVGPSGLVAALQALANLFESATGHDHTGAGKGKPIGSAGIASGIHLVGPVVDSGGLTVTAGGLTVTAGGLTVTAGGIGIGGAPSAIAGLYNTAGISGANAYGTRNANVLTASAGSATLASLSLEPSFNPNGQASVLDVGLNIVGFNANGSANAYGVKVGAVASGGGNNYGVYVDAPSGGSGENYAIRAGGVTHIGGGTSIGTTNGGLVIDNGGNAAPITNGSGISFGSLTSATASAGANGAPPATVAGYIRINVGGTARSIPYYNI